MPRRRRRGLTLTLTLAHAEAKAAGEGRRADEAARKLESSRAELREARSRLEAPTLGSPPRPPVTPTAAGAQPGSNPSLWWEEHADLESSLRHPSI